MASPMLINRQQGGDLYESYGNEDVSVSFWIADTLCDEPLSFGFEQCNNAMMKLQDHCGWPGGTYGGEFDHDCAVFGFMSYPPTTAKTKPIAERTSAANLRRNLVNTAGGEARTEITDLPEAKVIVSGLTAGSESEG